MAGVEDKPTPRWSRLRPHLLQTRLFHGSEARFRVVAAGRRSGKTELAKRFLASRALRGSPFPGPRYLAAAPTREQAASIFWEDLLALLPGRAVAEARVTNLTIRLVNGASIRVAGMDRPQRIEGSPWDGAVLDEFADMPPQTFDAHVRPALSDRRGWCWIMGVPEGRNHFHELFTRARRDTTGQWEAFHWTSATVLPAGEIEAARRDLDPETFAQEYEAAFLNPSSRAYYVFDSALHTGELAYDPDRDLMVCLDFNVSPGVAVIAQETELPSGHKGTAVVGEVVIPRNSNTVKVCREFLARFGGHSGRVRLYGDASGGASGSAKVAGSDWDLVRQALGPVFGPRLTFHVPRRNPPERARLNAVNSRLLSASGRVRLMLDQKNAPRTIADLEGVRLARDGSGKLDKAGDPELTHLSDALGYYVARAFPVRGGRAEPIAPMG